MASGDSRFRIKVSLVMAFVSHAQNFEDVLLWRALQDVERGFWIDVGAAHPSEHSVTRAFYDRGWHGVNIEPEPDFAAALRAERPGDVNLELAIGQASPRLTLQRFPGTGLSTSDPEIAAGHVAANFQAEPLEVEVLTLAEVCAAYAPSDIHFLKIDVEGAELDVLRSADFENYRPWIIIIEATFPGSPVQRQDPFEEVLTPANYRQCWFDGLNAFFLAAEHDSRLRPFFRTPPNVFDTFVLAEQLSAMSSADAASAQAEQASQHAEEATARAEAALMRADSAEQREAALAVSLQQAREAFLTAEQQLAGRKVALANTEQDLASERARLEAASRRLADLEQAAVDASRAYDSALEAIGQIAVDRQRALQRIRALENSTSWRMTGPLRDFSRAVRR